ncbi:hypothetical protein MVEN_00006500 [Mycena venus]|uniref:Secreted protein n=1 Tax=Mycena venus TaxID=2733690 RepID=A0A8H7DFT3_9AGAR|nr:hypothetical protein MVEN_00006500 [Mycena venus]
MRRVRACLLVLSPIPPFFSITCLSSCTVHATQYSLAPGQLVHRKPPADGAKSQKSCVSELQKNLARLLTRHSKQDVMSIGQPHGWLLHISTCLSPSWLFVQRRALCVRFSKRFQRGNYRPKTRLCQVIPIVVDTGRRWRRFNGFLRVLLSFGRVAASCSRLVCRSGDTFILYFLCFSILYRSAESSCVNDALTTSTPPPRTAPVVRRSVRILGDFCACRGGVNGGRSSATGREARFDEDGRDGTPGRPTRAPPHALCTTASPPCTSRPVLGAVLDSEELVHPL